MPSQNNVQLSNPYLDEYNIVNDRDKLLFGCDFDNISSWYLRSWTERQRLTALYAWAVPDTKAILTLANYSSLIEIGAGTGYWAGLIKQAGGDIVCYDSIPPKENCGNNWRHTKTYFEVNEGGPHKLLEHPDRTLFLCWAPYDQPMAIDCMRNYRGNILCWVGEGHGGCTGDEAFWEYVDEFFVEKTKVKIPQWDGIHDFLVVYERKHQ